MQSYTLEVRGEKHKEQVVDPLCNSTSKKLIIPEVGTAIRNKYPVVVYNAPPSLFLHNAEGHVTTKAVTTNAIQYPRMMSTSSGSNSVCTHQQQTMLLYL